VDLLADALENTESFFRRNSVRFLAAHPTCRIGIRDEYGREHPITADSEESR
jgi:hypothetical protein